MRRTIFLLQGRSDFARGNALPSTRLSLVVFPRGLGVSLRNAPAFAHRYGIHLLGGVVDGNYRGRLKAILHNAGQAEVIIPRHAAFCQGVLLPSTSHSVTPGEVVVEGDRGDTGGVNRVLSGNGQQRGPGAAVGRG